MLIYVLGREGDDACSVDEERKRKRLKSDDERPTGEETSKISRRGVERNTSSTKASCEEGPQIVVTLDGLTSKAIKDIMLRNRDAPNGPLLTTGKKPDKNNDEEDEEENDKFQYKGTNSSKHAGTSRQANSESREKGLEKMSERFGRINKSNEVHEYKEKYYELERERCEKKYVKGTVKEKHYEKLKDKYSSAGESKNKKLIAKLSEKFGKVDREFENKKRKYYTGLDDARYSYSSRKVDRSADRNGKYRRVERNTVRSGGFSILPTIFVQCFFFLTVFG